MNQNLKVSVAMPVFNGGHYFELALKSALAQTYSNLEIVIVNDGSTDAGETAAIAERYAARHECVKYVYQQNRGAGGALNTVLAEMTGDVFTWLSHDDLFEPHKTARQVEFFRRLGEPDAMLFSDWYMIGPAGEIITEVRYDHEELVQKPRLALLGQKINGVTLFIPRHILLEAGGFDERYRFVQDYDLWNKLIAKHDFFHLPEPLIRYRSHPGQDSHKPGNLIECNDLWTRIMDSRGEAERVHIAGSSYRFYRYMASQLEPFTKAVAHAERRASETLRDTVVSVIIPVSVNDAEFQETLGSVRAQISVALEIVVVDTSKDGVPIDAARGERLQVVRAPGADFWQAINKGVFCCLGDYISFATPGTRIKPNRVSRQVTVMQLEGSTISYSSHEILDQCRNSDETTPASQVRTDLLAAHMGRSNFRLETVMFHSSEFLGGLSFSAWSDDDLLLLLIRRGEPLFIDERLVAVVSRS